MSIKNKMTKVLSVLLAGAMSITAFTACDSKKDNDKDEKSQSVKEMLFDVIESASNTNTLSGVFSGDADTASKMNATIEFGSGIADALGTEVKPLTITSETKLKGDKAGTDIAVSYDEKNLASLNGVYDNASKTGYIKVPELSDAYISVSEKDLSGLKDEFAENNGIDLSSILSGNDSATAMVGNLSELKLDEWEDTLDDYIKVIVDNLPKETKEEDYKGSLSDVEYDYKLKTYTLTVEDVKKMVEDVFAKLKTDEKVKDIVVNVFGSQIDITADNYSSKLDSAKKELLDSMSDDTSSEEISLIFDGKDIVGIKEESTVIMVIDQKDAYVISVESEAANCLLKVTADDGKLAYDMTANFNDEEDGNGNISMTVKADNFEIVDKENGLANGDVTLTVTAEGKTIKLEASDKAEDKKSNSTLKFTIDDVEYVTMNSTNEITNASDISVPSGTIYTIDQIEKYQSSIKSEEFLTNIQTALGNDLLAALSKLGESVDGSDEDMDFSDDSDDVSADDEEDSIDLEKYYNEDGSFNYDKLKEDLGEEEYEAFMSQIDLDDFEVDADDIEL